jgi:CheY-like chemotaxis protein
MIEPVKAPVRPANHLAIPVVPPENRRVDKSPDRALWDNGRPLVLIIDTEETVRDLYGHWFSDLGFQVMCAVGKLGLRMALRQERPKMIVAELVARDLTLDCLFERLQCEESTRCIPVIVLTNSCDDAALAHARSLGAVAVLPKFGDLDSLHSWVTALCGDADE